MFLTVEIENENVGQPDQCSIILGIKVITGYVAKVEKKTLTVPDYSFKKKNNQCSEDKTLKKI